jgi:hypothetical protein
VEPSIPSAEPALPVFGTIKAALHLVARHPIVLAGAALLLACEGFVGHHSADARPLWYGDAIADTVAHGLTIVLVAGRARGVWSWSQTAARFARTLPILMGITLLQILPLVPIAGSAAALVSRPWLAVVCGAAIGYASIRLVFVATAIVVGNVGIMDAVRQSVTLTRGCFWRTVWLLVLLGMPAMLAESFPQPVPAIVDCLDRGLVQTAIVIAYLRLAGAAPPRPWRVGYASPVPLTAG